MLAGVDLLEMDPGQRVPHPQTTTPTGSGVAFVNDVLGNWHRHQSADTRERLFAMIKNQP
jgi:hypothetical protein